MEPLADSVVSMLGALMLLLLLFLSSFAPLSHVTDSMQDISRYNKKLKFKLCTVNVEWLCEVLKGL